MRRTAVTLLLVSVLAVPVALAAGGTAGTPSAGPAAAAPSADPGTKSPPSGDARITHFTLAGRGMVDQKSLLEDRPGPSYVWASESLRLRPTVRTDPSPRTKRACARLVDHEGEVLETVGCRVWNTSSRHKLATVELSKWPAGARGAHRVRVDLIEEVPNGTAGADGGTEPVRRDSRAIEVYVIGKQGDFDDDGLANAREVAEGTDFTRADTDGDSLSDRAEVYQYGSDPLGSDTTGDGIDDGTAASVRLPPTVPYAVHAVVVVILLGGAAVAYAASRLRRVLETGWDDASYGGAETVSAVDGGEADEEFRSTKEGEIIAVLHDHDGRMRQADLVDETEWSKATVSRLLSTLEDDGRVEKIRVGRGNVVQLTGPGPTLDDDRSRASG